MAPGILHATSYYVGVGSNAKDTNSGLSAATPFATPQHAAGLVRPGDTVLLMSGTYTNLDPKGSVIDITTSGKPDAWITFKAGPKQHPILRSSGWGHISIHQGASYIRIEGLDIFGHSDDISLAEAQKHQTDGLYAYTNSNGISIDGRPDTGPSTHHIEIVGNILRKCPGAGIGACHADYVTISHNKVFDNAWWSVYDTSGISVWQARNFDTAPGYHNVIVGNECYGNRNFLPDLDSHTLTDGNGIILDDCKNTQGGSTQGAYHNRTLIANNLCFQNGGSGIHVFMSEHADVVNNTCVDNNQSPEIRDGQLFSNSGNDVVMLNNILVGPADKPIDSNWNNGNVTFDHNILWGGTPVISGPHDLKVDPMLMITRTGDKLTITENPKSPAIRAGEPFLSVKDDLQGRRRPKSKNYDLGCLQLL